MTRFAHLGLTCRDPAATERFYTRHFGFRRVRVVALGGGRQIVFLRHENSCLELFAGEGSDPAGPPPNDGHGFPGFRHLAFEVTDIEAFARTLGPDLKINLGPLRFDSFIPGWAAIWIRDPDDRVVEVCQGYQDDPNPPPFAG